MSSYSARNMAEESSNDASIVAIISDDESDPYSDKPIIKLFKRLIANDSKQNTILTNNQILDLLKIEFDIDILVLHSLEVDIYITLMKKFLKDWPRWEDFDSIVNEAKKKNDLSAIDNMLQEKHDNLKEYLQSVIDIAKPLAKTAIVNAKEHLKNKREMAKEAGKETADDTVVLEVDATRSQLNSLFLRYPINSAVFNYDKQEPKSIIIVNYFKTESILNWWDINIEIQMKYKHSAVLYKREMAHELKHMLVNKKLPFKTNPCIALDQDVKVKTWKKTRETEKSQLIEYIDKIAAKHPDINDESHEVYKFIKKDLQLLPTKVYAMAAYKRYLSEYSYVRYLYAENEKGTSKDKYDLQLEETILPMVRFSVYDFDLDEPIVEQTSVTLECVSCNMAFRGPSLMTELREHFEVHATERPWSCTKCGLEIPMLTLAERWWSHQCISN